MSDLGQLLKQARMEKGISLDELQDVTKIRKRYLEAIEEGDFKALPGNFYVRAFIRTYAETVGLDPNEVLQLYGNVIPSPTPESNAEPVRRKPRSNRKTERWSKLASSILFWAFLILIIAIIWYYFYASYDGNDGKNVMENADPITENSEPLEKIPEENPQVPDEQPAPDPEPELEIKPAVTLENQSGSTYTYKIENIESLEVELSFTGECWVLINENDANGKWLYEKIHKAGETYTWSGDTPLRVRLGNARNAQVKVNGIDLEPIDSSSPANLMLTWTPVSSET